MHRPLLRRYAATGTLCGAVWDPSRLLPAGSWEQGGWDEQLRGLVEAESSSLLWAPRGATKSLRSRARSPALGLGLLLYGIWAGTRLRGPNNVGPTTSVTAVRVGSLLRGLLDQGLEEVLLFVSEDHKGTKAAVSGELPGAGRKRCTSHSHPGARVGTGEERGIGGPLGALRGSAQKFPWPSSKSSSRSVVSASRRRLGILGGSTEQTHLIRSSEE